MHNASKVFENDFGSQIYYITQIKLKNAIASMIDALNIKQKILKILCSTYFNQISVEMLNMKYKILYNIHQMLYIR